jgi:hypothetical protein
MTASTKEELRVRMDRNKVDFSHRTKAHTNRRDYEMDIIAKKDETMKRRKKLIEIGERHKAKV